ncbi:Uncharacterized protein DAT39_017069 [Clarias magur]|uniref:Uncharacterized protein n=1 Tax=Clarias magur TaxID=1594786 RepID=A0A8J4TLZ7_CLAMG|nr:Uncharacterized protein DAT39_017069 [Clarias magur]
MAKPTTSVHGAFYRRFCRDLRTMENSSRSSDWKRIFVQRYVESKTLMSCWSLRTHFACLDYAMNLVFRQSSP